MPSPTDDSDLAHSAAPEGPPRNSRREYFEQLIFTSLGNRRFTQNSPILPEVWLAYAKDPTAPQDLLLTPHRAAGPGKLAVAVRRRLKKERRRKRGRSPMALARDEETLKRDPKADLKPPRVRVAYNEFNVVCELYFDELARVVLPLSYWWQCDLVGSMKPLLPAVAEGEADPPHVFDQLLALFKPKEKELQKTAKKLMRAALEAGRLYQPRQGKLDAHIVWMAQAVGTMAFLAGGASDDDLPQLDPVVRTAAGPPDPIPWSKVTDSLFDMFRGVAARAKDLPELLLWNLQLNRKCSSSVFFSTVAVKADAAQRVFRGGGEDQKWAILDSGIDARHMAFRRRGRDGAPESRDERAFVIRPSKRKGKVVENHTRIVKTYDFNLVRDLLSDPEGMLDPEIAKKEYPRLTPLQRDRLASLEPRTKAALKRQLAGGRMLDWEVLEKVIEIPHHELAWALVQRFLGDPEGMLDPEIAKKKHPGLTKQQRDGLAGLEPKTKAAVKREVAALTKDQRDSLASLEPRTKAALRRELAGRMVNWEVLEKVIEILDGDEKEYEAPIHKHGTHVAGILGADWRSSDSESDRLSAAPGEEVVCQGICPKIQLYDLRVLDDDGRGDEFSINSALQWVRSINQRTDALVIHGVNLSLAIPHDMANFACGRTPVCEEAERLVGAGVVVVAAAGNRGKTEHRDKKGYWQDAYQSISITDPGNADGAITVGATHKLEPHTYGVSYFSSRGPTGDGRRKPDLVAPGEKIWSTTPGQDAEEMDGTSQAAPHVAGAAALLMQRYPELIGRPREIKRILCESATDLGREPYFQGAGMLDILRALQSF